MGHERPCRGSKTQANGLSGAASLFEGQTLRLPAGVMRNTYNASSVTPYNPAETLGDVTPSTPQAVPPKKQKCGIVGQVLLVVIAIIVVALTRLPIQNFLTSVFQAAGASQAVAATTAAALSYRAANAIGSVVSQAVGVATGIQEKFSWSEVARSYRSASVDQGPISQLGRNLLETVLREAAKSAINQSINMTLGLQDKFSWAAVASAGVGGGIGYKVGNSPLLASASKNVVKYTVSVATAVANAATRSVLEGTDFGDNLRSAVPSIVGNMIADGFSSLVGIDLSPNVPDSQGTSTSKAPGIALGTVRTNVACEVPIVQAAVSQDEPVEVVIVRGYRNTLRGQLSKAIDAGISIGNKLVVGAGKNLFGYAPLDGSNSALNTWRTYQNIHNLGSYRSTLDGIEAFGKNGTVGGALFENFRNPSALGFAGAALEVVPLLRVVPSQTVSRIVAKAEFSVPAKALDIVPEGPLAKQLTGSNTNVIGPSGANGPNPFGRADFTVAGGVNFQVAVPTARGGSGVETAVQMAATGRELLPSGVGGTGAAYNKATGQGLYVLRDELGNIRYIGRGDAPARIQTHADSIDKSEFIGEVLFDNNLTKAQAKGLEQRLINQFGGASKHFPNSPLLNRINSYSLTNPNAPLYRDAVTDGLWLDTLKKVGQ